MGVCWIMIVLWLSPAFAATATAEGDSDLFEPIPAATVKGLPKKENAALATIRKMRTTAEVTVVKVKSDLLDKKTLNINLSADKGFEVERENIDRRSKNDFGWYGKASKGRGLAIIYAKEGSVTGTIHAGADLYRLWPLGRDLHALVLEDPSKSAPCDPPESEENSSVTLQAQKEPGPEKQDRTKARGEHPIIRLLVAFTPAAKKAVPDGNIQALIRQGVWETNVTYLASGIWPRIEVGHVVVVNYRESGNTKKDLKRFRKKSDGHMDSIHSLRNSYAADVCILIIGDDPTDGFAGSAAKIYADAKTAFAVVRWDCVTGYYNFGHEIGHLQGARHSPECDSATKPFRYGHGYCYDNDWRTIMALALSDHPCSGRQRLPYWSNPRKKIGAVRSGTRRTHDNVRVLNETSYYIADFRY